METSGSVLPTGIVLATGEKPGLVKISNRKPLDASGQICLAKMKVKQDQKYKPFLVIDGQHRLFGITMSSVIPYPVPVTILLGAGKITQMANFEIINNKATRIASAHLNELRAVMYKLSPDDDEKLKNLLGQLGVASLDSSGIVSELNGAGMAFDGILDFPSNHKMGFVSSTTLVQNVARSRETGFLHYLDEDDNVHLTSYNAMWAGMKAKFSKRWKKEVALFKKFAEGDAAKSEARAGLRLLHSGSLAVLGSIADKELASTSYRKKWLDDPDNVRELVENGIFANMNEAFWDDPDLQVDNTGKGRTKLRELVDAVLVP
ncbi:MAG: hypothetical protein PSW75_09260 [bacterium]|nr:hypothetical protein [bacterium]